MQTGLAASGVPTWTWTRQGLIVQDSGHRGYLLVDPSSGRAQPLASNDSLTRHYSPLLSPDGRTFIVARERPDGFTNEMWQRRLGAGAWEHVPYTFTGDPTLLRWDESGIYAAFHIFDRQRWEIWRAASPRVPFTPLLTGLRWCTAASWEPPSLSDDNRHLACTQTTTASDIWLVSGFDVAGR